MKGERSWLSLNWRTPLHYRLLSAFILILGATVIFTYQLWPSPGRFSSDGSTKVSQPPVISGDTPSHHQDHIQLLNVSGLVGNAPQPLGETVAVDVDEDKAWEQEQEARKAQVASVCAQYGSLNSNRSQINCIQSSLKWIIADDVDKVLFCSVPKVGCTSWKSALVALSHGQTHVTKERRIHNWDFLKSKGLTSLSLMTSGQVMERLGAYKKFMFVREPLERQISAYRDKLEGHGEYYFTMKYGRDIVRKYRKHPSTRSLKYGQNVSYPEFVHYVLDGHRDLHWIPYQDLCSPCAIHYDYIGKYETFDVDATNILRRLFNKTLAEARSLLPTMNSNPKVETSKIEPKYLAQISAKNISQLVQYYRKDFEMFSYDQNEPHKLAESYHPT